MSGHLRTYAPARSVAEPLVGGTAPPEAAKTFCQSFAVQYFRSSFFYVVEHLCHIIETLLSWQ